ncbi:TPA: hypothetical protein ACPJ0L_002614 [Vibrio alginolyticus]|uniref:hypothetical protein n=1 Tax=Vibrio alginolyticus TaxID=663 RepID=UPI00215FBD7D|nr:hypothetical protein [Vibrio alginolyticus]MCS0133271.1 hypothetical protein [Vibrio alginolyticus]
MTISTLVAAVFVVVGLCLAFKKSTQNKKIYKMFEDWNWWIEIVNEDHKPWLSGKVVRKSKNYQFAIVGCLKRDSLDTELLNNLETKFGALPDFVPCQCLILDASTLVLGGVEDDKKVAEFYHCIPTKQSSCVKLVIQDSTIVLPEDDEDLNQFELLWSCSEMQSVGQGDDESKFKAY